MRSSKGSMRLSCGRREDLKAASGPVRATTDRLGLVVFLVAAIVMLASLPVYAQAEKKDVPSKRSAEKLSGKSMSEWMNDLKERDPSIRERAIAALKAYGADAREAAPAIIRAISDKDMSLRVNAIITLGFIGMEPKDRQAGINALKVRLQTTSGQRI